MRICIYESLCCFIHHLKSEVQYSSISGTTASKMTHPRANTAAFGIRCTKETEDGRQEEPFARRFWTHIYGLQCGITPYCSGASCTCTFPLTTHPQGNASTCETLAINDGYRMGGGGKTRQGCKQETQMKYEGLSVATWFLPASAPPPLSSTCLRGPERGMLPR